jgi:hypothetical protein
VSREVEGLPWPEGDPDGLRGIATHAVGLAAELEHRQAFVKGLDPTGWLGVGRDEFAVSLAEHAHALGSGAAAMHAAASALFKLARTVEDAQHTVLDAARRLKAARDAATTALNRAEQARATADSDGLKLLTGPLSTPGNPVQTPSEIEADRAEHASYLAQNHANDVERWAQGRARTANDDVSREDRTCAGLLEHAGLVSAGGTPSLVGAAPPTPTDPLKALGQLLLGPVGSQGDLGLKALLSSPPPPPPPPPKPVPQHHSSFWNKLAVGGMAVVTTGLVVVDALQLGLDPVTDGATVAAGGETVALATDAAAGEIAADTEVAAGSTALGTDAAVAETEADVLAAEGAPAEGLPVRPGGGGGGGTPRQFVTTPRGTTFDVPEGYVGRAADNGKGIVYQDAGSAGNANSIRIMEPTPRYPNGYFRYYNERGQPLDVNGRPGPQSATHIPEDYLGRIPGWPH